MERDDLIINDQYSTDAIHSEEAGKSVRKKIWLVTLILSVITIVEVIMGAYVHKDGSATWEMVKLSFIVMTLVKAGYIVMVFMHLGDEQRGFKLAILAPYILFILYLIFICVSEASYQGSMLTKYFL